MNAVPLLAILSIFFFHEGLIVDVSGILCYECSYGEKFQGSNAKENEACLLDASSSLMAVTCHESHRSCVKMSGIGDKIGIIMLRQCSNAYAEPTCRDLGSIEVNSSIEGLPSVTKTVLEDAKICACSTDKCNNSPGWRAATSGTQFLNYPKSHIVMLNLMLPFISTLA